MIKNFHDYLNEASLNRHPALPGGKEGTDSYKRQIEIYSKEQVREIERRYGPKMGQLPMLANKLQSYQKGVTLKSTGELGLILSEGSSGYEILLNSGSVRRYRREDLNFHDYQKDLEKLAEKTIRFLYGRIIEDVILDIKFPEDKEIPDMMKDVPNASPKKPEIPQIEELKNKDIISEIQKRKIINNITQGEAVNSKKALNLPEVIDGMKKIMGEEKAKEYIKILNEVTDIAQAFYWIIPVDVQETMWKTNKGGMSGAVKVDWEEKKESDEDLAKKILDDLNDDGDLPEEAEDLFYETQPTIIARGQDFAMLVHEAVKGVYELIAAIAIPEDEEIAKTVLMNTDSLADEIEDIKHGPKMVADMRDYFNTFSEIKKDVIPNLREFVVGALIAGFPAPEFNDIVLSILARDDKYRQTIQEIIDDKIAEVRKFQAEEALRKKGISGIDNDDNYNPQGKTSAPSEDVDYSTLTAEELESVLSSVDYSMLSKEDLKELLDAAVKFEYYEEARSIHTYIKDHLKESEFADEVWEKIHERGGYPSNPDPSQVNESESFNDLYKGTSLTIDVIDGKTREKKGTIKTKINEMVLEGNSYFLKCSGDVNIVYDKDTEEFVEGYKPQYLVYSVDELNSEILNFLK
jgi:hypothetical protein